MVRDLINSSPSTKGTKARRREGRNRRREESSLSPFKRISPEPRLNEYLGNVIRHTSTADEGLGAALLCLHSPWTSSMVFASFRRSKMEFSGKGLGLDTQIWDEKDYRALESKPLRLTATNSRSVNSTCSKLGCAFLLRVLAESCVGSYHSQTSERCLSVVVRGCIALQTQNLIKFIDLRCCYLSEKTRECEWLRCQCGKVDSN